MNKEVVDIVRKVGKVDRSDLSRYSDEVIHDVIRALLHNPEVYNYRGVSKITGKKFGTPIGSTYERKCAQYKMRGYLDHTDRLSMESFIYANFDVLDGYYKEVSVEPPVTQDTTPEKKNDEVRLYHKVAEICEDLGVPEHCKPVYDSVIRLKKKASRKGVAKDVLIAKEGSGNKYILNPRREPHAALRKYVENRVKEHIPRKIDTSNRNKPKTNQPVPLGIITKAYEDENKRLKDTLKVQENATNHYIQKYEKTYKLNQRYASIIDTLNNSFLGRLVLRILGLGGSV